MEREGVASECEAHGPKLKAVEYVRMSTEHQQYSTENQHERIREYAQRHGLEIVKTFTDAGKSGLRIDGRQALQQLIREVELGTADFQVILVYDVSRWGRFQDADESAYYEYICRRAGIQVIYCAEQFENDGSPVSTIVKGVKRAMAGEYSRELSVKVFAGQCRLVELGYRQGACPGYGLRRLLVDSSGVRKGELAFGEHKSIQTDRVVLVPGPEHERQVVNDMYRYFIDECLCESEIASRLNRSGLRTDLGRPWNRATVHQVLTNEKYIGNNVYNRVSFKLKKMRIANPPDMWIRRDQAFEPVVPPEVFYTAQGIIRARARRFSNDELIQRLRALYEHRGCLSGLIIDETEGMPSSTVYAYRFGSLLRAYEMVGFSPSRDYRYLEINRYLRRLHPGIVAETESRIGALGGSVERDEDTDLLTVNREFTASIVLARCGRAESGRLRWRIRLDAQLAPDLSVAVRLDEDNKSLRDYYLLPRLDFGDARLTLAERNPVEFESYRFDSLDSLYDLARRYQMRLAA